MESWICSAHEFSKESWSPALPDPNTNASANRSVSLLWINKESWMCFQFRLQITWIQNALPPPFVTRQQRIAAFQQRIAAFQQRDAEVQQSNEESPSISFNLASTLANRSLVICLPLFGRSRRYFVRDFNWKKFPVEAQFSPVSKNVTNR